MTDERKTTDALDASERVHRNEDGTVTVTLAHPFEHDHDEIKELRLRKPNARDLEVTDEVKGDIKKSLRLLSQLSGLPMSAVRKLEGDDYVVASEAIGKFLSGQSVP